MAPPLDILFYFDTVRRFWEPDDAIFNQTAWTDSLLAILGEIAALEAELKLDLFSALVNAYSEALVRAPEIGLEPLPALSSPPTPADVDAFLARPTSLVHCAQCNKFHDCIDIFPHITTKCTLFYHEKWWEMEIERLCRSRTNWAKVGSEISVRSDSLVVAHPLGRHARGWSFDDTYNDRGH